MFNFDGLEARITMDMLNAPISDLARLIGRKWFLPLEKLAERSGVGLYTIENILHGKKVGQESMEKLRVFLENYKGETI